MITFRQTNSGDRTSAHTVPQKVISPLQAGNLLQEMDQSGTIREFLFEMTKDGHVYWIGAAVPSGTSDFSKVQVFFHPTPVQNGRVIAKDTDYPTFTGGWSAKVQRYVEMQGAQLAGVRKTALMVPFMMMKAARGRAADYMFATKSVETLNAIMTAVRDAATPGGVAPGTAAVQISKIAVSSFSSGIDYMRLFIGTFGSTRLIVETTDFDSPFIIAEKNKPMTRSPGAKARVFSQQGPMFPQFGWVTMPATSFRNIAKYRDKGVHAQIGWMMFFTASMGSSIT